MPSTQRVEAAYQHLQDTVLLWLLAQAGFQERFLAK